ncbi:MAG: O-acetyl-ADP-ribose deacetylase [Firmicutes bacterium HGW-Firmicutes-12]|nr:MAG: O-acetyl-ADP-ribose deacetylase [Firmicutes bacterium HGW-Firmicutes-12]
MKSLVAQTELVIVQGDLTQQEVEAIVNAANSRLMGGGGVDGAIHKAGGPQILVECKEIVNRQGSLPPGEAVITSGGNLKSAYVIHTVGPIWRGGNNNEAVLLKNAYNNSLKLAKENGIKTIAFPSISTGAYAYPLEQAAEIALSTVLDFIKKDTHFSEVRFILFNEDILNVYQKKCLSMI